MGEEGRAEEEMTEIFGEGMEVGIFAVAVLYCV